MGNLLVHVSSCCTGFHSGPTGCYRTRQIWRQRLPEERNDVAYGLYGTVQRAETGDESRTPTFIRPASVRWTGCFGNAASPKSYGRNQWPEAYGIEPNDAVRTHALQKHPDLLTRLQAGSLPLAGTPFGGLFDGVAASAYADVTWSIYLFRRSQVPGATTTGM
jgi:hypothetical protein